MSLPKKEYILCFVTGFLLAILVLKITAGSSSSPSSCSCSPSGRIQEASSVSNNHQRTKTIFPSFPDFAHHYSKLYELSCDSRVKLLRYCANQDQVDEALGLTSQDRVLKLEYLHLLQEYMIAQTIVSGKAVVHALQSPRVRARFLGESKVQIPTSVRTELSSPSSSSSNENNNNIIKKKRHEALASIFTSMTTGFVDPPKLSPFSTTMTWQGVESMRKILTIVKMRGLAGHFLEAGVWRGGLSLYAKAVLNILYEQEHLKKSNNNNKQPPHVWICDSFEGLPLPRSDLSKGEEFYRKDPTSHGILSVPQEIVEHNFRSFGLYDPNTVHFEKGYFIDSLPRVRADLIKRGMKLSVLRADGDMYESTIDILYNLYDLIEVGGIIIIDDFSWKERLWMARVAVEDFFEVHKLWDDHFFVNVDDTRAYFTKVREIEVQKWRYDKTIELTKQNQERERAIQRAEGNRIDLVAERKQKTSDVENHKFPVRPFDDGLRSVDQQQHDKYRLIWDKKRREIKDEENKLLESYWYVDESDDLLMM